MKDQIKPSEAHCPTNPVHGGKIVQVDSSFTPEIEGFDSWWDVIGSGILPIRDNDHEEHAKRVSLIAFAYGKNEGLKNGSKKRQLLIDALERITEQCERLDLVRPETANARDVLGIALGRIKHSNKS